MEQVKENFFFFFLIILNHKLKLNDFTDLSPSPTCKHSRFLVLGFTCDGVNSEHLTCLGLGTKFLVLIRVPS